MQGMAQFLCYYVWDLLHARLYANHGICLCDSGLRGITTAGCCTSACLLRGMLVSTLYSWLTTMIIIPHIIVTACQWSWGKVIFSLVSVILFGEWAGGYAWSQVPSGRSEYARYIPSGRYTPKRYNHRCWHLGIATEEGGTHPTRMLSC